MSLRSPDSLAPDRNLLEADAEDESGVCARPSSLPTLTTVLPAATTSAQPDSLPELGGRSNRVEQKVRIARLLLEYLPRNDPSASLLRVAVIRRDEVLLDGVLTHLQARDLSPA